MTCFFIVGLIVLIRGEKAHRVPKSWSLKSLYVCVRAASTSVNFLKTSENKKLRITGMYRATCRKVTSSMCGQVRHGFIVTFRVC